jgi:hypothetical protein
MPIKKNVREFALSDAELLSAARHLGQCVTRDAREFTSYGYTKEAAKLLKTRLAAFQAMPTDLEVEQVQAEATQFKIAKEAFLKGCIKEITHRARLLLGEESPKFKRFGTKGLDNMKDADLSLCGKRVADVAKALLSELAVRGVTQAMIDDLDSARQSFDEAILAQGKAMSERGTATNDRIRVANELYALTVELAEAGKAIWQDKDQARYRDYVLYSSEGKPTVKESTPAAPATTDAQ